MGKQNPTIALHNALVNSGLKPESIDAIETLVRLETIIPAPVPNTFAEKVIRGRIPCAYGSTSCEGIRFAPNGVGSKQHTTCERGRKAMAAARKGN